MAYARYRRSHAARCACEKCGRRPFEWTTRGVDSLLGPSCELFVRDAERRSVSADPVLTLVQPFLEHLVYNLHVELTSNEHSNSEEQSWAQHHIVSNSGSFSSDPVLPVPVVSLTVSRRRNMFSPWRGACFLRPDTWTWV